MFAYDLHAKGCTIVFDKRDVKPVENMYAFVQMHVSLDPNLYDLVHNEHGNNYYYCQDCLVSSIHFFSESLSSMHVVA